MDLNTFFFYKKQFYKNTRLIFVKNLKTMTTLKTKNIETKRKRINFKSKKKLNSELAHNDEVFIDFLLFASKIATISSLYSAVGQCAGNRKFLLSFKLKKSALFFKAFTQAIEHEKLSNLKKPAFSFFLKSLRKYTFSSKGMN